jgi:L-ascorbate metabolism protein UlaG (beta-lactamase superfamily)
MARVDVRWLGHSAFHISGAGADVLVDPFLSGNPKAAATADELPADQILLTHGHGDHLGDTVDIAKRTGATVLAITELAAEIEGSGVENVVNPNYGGTVTFDWGWVKLTPAWHSGSTPSGTVHPPAGLLIHYGDHLIYHLGDTALFSDLQLIARRGDQVELALVPIGGHFTMDRYDAVTAVELINPSQVIPIHYDTMPLIATDAQAFKSDVQNAGFSEVLVLQPGDTHTLR